MNHYDWLISRLDAFIRKYYANQLLRGSLILLTCLLLYILTLSISEYYLYLPAWLRVLLVTLFAVLGTTATIAWVIIPLFKMARMGKVISHEQAADIVGRHFPEISDKLLNILQLKKQQDLYSSRELIEASIDQKASQLSVIPITSAVDLSGNRRYLKYLLPVMLTGILILIFSPSIFIDASERLLQPTRTFEKPAPFRFVVLNEPLLAVRNTDFTLKVKVEGEALPAAMTIESGSDRMEMQLADKQTFQYTFRNLTEPVTFRLWAAGFYSAEYQLKVAQKPVLKSIKVQLDYPDYTGRKDETRNSLGDLSLPVGTTVRWAFLAEHTDEAAISFGTSPARAMEERAGIFGYTARFLADTNYTIVLKNRGSNINEQYAYHVQVTPDQHPVIQLQEIRDTVTGKQVLLHGTAGDDYGISRVLFHYQISDAQNQPLVTKAIPLQVNKGPVTPFQHYFDIDLLQLQQGQKLTYFIEAWDNDGVHGSKASRSEVMSYIAYTAEQLDSAINANAEQINSGLSNTAQQTKQMQSELKEMQSKLLQSDKMDWEQQQSLRDIAEKQMQMQQNLEEIRKRFEEQMQQSVQKNFSDDLREKQEELKKQMDNLLNNELKEQMKKLQELMAKLNKENAFKAMQQMEQENKLFNMDLERMKELMKKLEMQMRMEDMANKMEELAEKQLEIKRETDHNKKNNQELSQEQQNLKKELDKAMNEEMKELKELNKKMERPQDKLEDVAKEGQNAQQNMQESEQQLQQQQNSKASQSQSKAAQNLQQMANAMRSMAGGMDIQQIEIDIRAVRQLLTNLMRLSFDQEQLMKKVQETATSSASYLTNQKEQNRLYNNSVMIRDSLFVLSKRLFQLHEAVNRETTELEHNMQYARQAIEDRRVGEAVTKQQFVMTRTNNLALMLNEMLSNLMQMQSQAMKAQSQQQGACQNPGGMKPKPGAGQQLSDIITQQQQLGDAMQQMQNAMQRQEGKGEQGRSSEDGQQDGGEYGNAEQLARMAQQQAAIRRQLQQLQSLLNSKGMGNARELRDIQEKMDRTETDLVNRRLSAEMLKRQREILTRLLETEKAIREQEQDDKRSSKNPADFARPVPPALMQHMKDRQHLLEFYRTVPPQLKPYYRTMVEQYYKNIGSTNN